MVYVDMEIILFGRKRETCSGVYTREPFAKARTLGGGEMDHRLVAT